MVHPRAHRWRAREASPFRVLVPAWIVMWIGIGALTGPWRSLVLYSTPWTWVPAVLLFAAGFLHLFAFWRALQLGAAGWSAGGSQREPAAEAGHDWNSFAGSPSGLPWASLRDAGVEYRNWPRGLLAAHRVRDCHRCRHDSSGGCGVGEEVWGGVSALSQDGASGDSKTDLMSMMRETALRAISGFFLVARIAVPARSFPAPEQRLRSG